MGTKTIRVMIGILALMLPWAWTPANAVQVTATLTADNHYGLYYGTAAGEALTFVGRNEAGYYGSQGLYNWSVPETWTFQPGPSDYLYVLAYDDAGGGGQMWVGEFRDELGRILWVSNLRDWEYALGGAAPPDDSPLPSDDIIKGVIATATWSKPLASAPIEASPWGPSSVFPQISLLADTIWIDSFYSDTQNWVLFRTAVPVGDAPMIDGAAPEPATLALFGLGLAGIPFVRRRRTRK